MKNNSVVTITILVWSLVIPLTAQAGHARTDTTPDIITEKEAVAEALAGNPGIAGMQSRAEAMSHIPSQAGSLPDPLLSLGALNLPTDSFSTTQENMTQLQVGLAQSFPFPGKLGLREQAAHHESDSARFDSDEVRLATVRETRSRWWSLYYLDRALGVVQRNQELLRQFVKIAETKYKTGQGLQSDVLLAQVELSRLLDIEIDLKASRQGHAAQLNALMDRPAQSPVKLPAQITEQLPAIPDAETLRTEAMNSRPLLASQRSRADAAGSRIALAEKDYYPDFTLAGAYGSRSGVNPVNGRNRSNLASIQLSMTIPLYAGNKQTEAVAQRKAEAAREQFRLTDQMRAVDAEISSALADYRARHSQTALFRTGIIPQASQTVSSMLASYQVNKVDFLNLVRAQITLYNYETQYWKAVTAGWQAWARLEAAVGKEPGKGLIHD
ncbi:MAG: TolC family protein [Mariprofundaceae bacterium]|nr:TolC family protein [Mariprofundaceae bacterium]